MWSNSSTFQNAAFKENAFLIWHLDILDTVITYSYGLICVKKTHSIK